MDRTSVSELEKINKSADANGSDVTKENYYSKENNHFRRQAFIVLGTFLLTLSAGATAGFSAVLIPQLQHAKGHKKYSTEMVSWVAAISSLALLFGNMISGYLMDRLGRRSSQMLLSLFYIGGWITIAITTNIHLILVGRFITGLCQGWLGPLGPVFVGEISSPAYRGLFLASLSLSIAFGVFMSHLFGTLLHWSHASLLCGTFPLIGCIILYYAPESPAWFASKNQINKCIKSFQWYRGTSPSMKEELDKMILEHTKKVHKRSKIETLKTNISKPEFWKPLCIMLVFFAITQLSGINVFCAYTTEIMEVLLGSKTNTYAAMLGIDILRCVALLTACIMLRRLGRRPIAIFSGTFTSLSLIILSIYLYLVEANVIKQVTPVISLGLTAVYIVVSHIGIGPLPWNMVGEVFASETKGIGSGLSVMMTSVFFFGTVKTAPAMFKNIGHYGTYLFYGMSTLIGTIFLYFCLPETKGKTLLQIEERFRQEKKDNRNHLRFINLINL
ncbi:unnamed protein product [Parnassius mnemosyne]|uniref:Major facilitator superfamily (MFS) profile domain-containing protein n=1 Tax=Parnassius mnemosyne TaxID=213953 RepID=A0AAV1K9R9_9NEOP